MSHKLYEEALADAKQVTRVAEDRAKKAVLDVVIPRIQKLIENELLDNAGGTSVTDVLTDRGKMDDLGLGDAVTEPDAEGKVTLDLDSLDGAKLSAEDGEFELDLESTNTLKALRSRGRTLKENIDSLERAIKKIVESKETTIDEVSRTISLTEDTYDRVQENLDGSSDEKLGYETRLEGFYKKLKKVQETLMSKKLNEDQGMDAAGDDVDLDAAAAGDEDAGGDNELTLKLTGLPDDVNLDDVGVDLIGGSDDDGGEDGDDDLDLDLDLDASGDDDDDGDDDAQMEGNQIVEIDESMLRAEIKRMAFVRESSGEDLDANGEKPGTNEFDDFGGATDQGEPLEQPIRESDWDIEDGMHEGDEVLEVKKALHREAVRRQRMRSRMASIKTEAKTARGGKLRSLKENYDRLARMFNGSLRLSKKHKTTLKEASNHRGQSTQTVSSNSTPRRQAGPSVSTLRKKLAESNLQSTKLMYANKVLQSETLNARQRAQVIKALDECKTPREAKLVYESVVKRLGAARRDIKENAVVGSSSRSTRSGSTSETMNEGADLKRWQTLAGLK